MSTLPPPDLDSFLQDIEHELLADDDEEEEEATEKEKSTVQQHVQPTSASSSSSASSSPPIPPPVPSVRILEEKNLPPLLKEPIPADPPAVVRVLEEKVHLPTSEQPIRVLERFPVIPRDKTTTVTPPLGNTPQPLQQPPPPQQLRHHPVVGVATPYIIQPQPPPPTQPVLRTAAGKVWEDPVLATWPEQDFRLFIGNLAPEVTDEQLQATFREYSSIQRLRVVRNPQTNEGKGYGFISFAEPMEMLKALREKNGKLCGKRPMIIHKSKVEERNVQSGSGSSSSAGAVKRLKKKR